MNETDLRPYLRPTEFLDSDQPEVAELAQSLRHDEPTQQAVVLFDWVRDHIRYDPRCAADSAEQHRASAVLAQGRGYCVQKAVLLAALGRALALPSRLGFADVRNHQMPPKLMAVMQTNLFVFHGYTEFWLNNRWLKATPTFDHVASRKAGVLPVVLDGESDAMLHPVDPQGQPYIEYLRDRGSYADLPFAKMREVFAATYKFPEHQDM
jgi:transglutaminase-like putative cysteine protease